MPFHSTFVWPLAKRVDSRVARCNICRAEIIYCGNTTNIHRHQNDKHHEIYNKTKEEFEWTDINDVTGCVFVKFPATQKQFALKAQKSGWGRLCLT